MTVREMIEELQTLPQDLEVYRQDHEWGPDVTTPKIAEVERRIGTNHTWSQHLYREKEPDTYEYKTVVLMI